MNNHAPTIPIELIEQILLKLPVRSVTRSKRVCKSWLSLISDPKFGTSHHDLGATSSDSHRILLRSNDEFSSVVHSIGMDFSAVQLPLPPPSPPHADHASMSSPVFRQYYVELHNKHWILGSCRGLVLLNYRKSNELILWNPSVGVHKRFPYSDKYDLVNGYLYGFGYDASTDDYLLTLIKLNAYAQIFSFKTNSWNRVGGVSVPYKTHESDFQAGTLFNGALHWLVFVHRIVTNHGLLIYVEEYAPLIIAFDLTQRTLTEIRLFDHCNLGKYNINGLRVMGGRFGVCCTVRACEKTTEIWVMEEYKVHSSWTKAIVIPTSNPVSPLCITKDGGIFGSNGTGTVRLEKRDDKGELLQHFIGEGQGCANLQSAMYTESLLPIPVSLVGTRGEDQQ